MGARRKTSLSKTWLQERKEILHKIKDQVRLYLGEETPDITQYAKAYKQDLSRPWVQSNSSEVFVALEQSTVVFGGDFHPFAQAQRTHLRVLRKVVQERPVVLAMECLFISDQPFVDQYLAGTLEEDEFLRKVAWDRVWGFPWMHYKPLFEFAKKNGVRILGLNIEVDGRTGLTLSHRDEMAARHLAQEIKKDPETLYYVLYGDLHIANAHLPKALRKHFKSSGGIEICLLFLNSESIYFKLAESSLENEVEVVRFSDREFCLLSSPPWVKWHSYLMYLEENFDVDLQLDDDDDDFDEWEFQVDHTDHVCDLVKMISTALEIELDTNAIEVYSMKDPQAIIVTKNVLSKEEFQIAHDLIQGDRSFFIPKVGFFYLSKATINHAATLAGQYIHANLSRRMVMAWDYPQDFVRSIWVEAMAFLLSKFVNPKRKAQTMTDLKKQLEAFDKEDQGREPLLLALDQKMLELLKIYADSKRVQTFKPRERSSYTLASKFIGEILGNRYFVLYEKKILGINDIRDLLSEDLGSDGFETFYYNQLKSLDQFELEG